MIFSKKYKSGFTLIELMVVVSIIAILSAVVLVSINNVRDKGGNSAMVQQVSEYAKAVQLSYAPNGNRFPTAGGTQLGCLVVTSSSGNRCRFNTVSATINAYPVAQRRIIGNHVNLTAINPPIVSSNGRVFDSVRYGSDANGSYFVLEYPMKNTTDCGLHDATQFGARVGNVIICRYVSR